MEKAHWLFKDWKFVPFTKELPKYVAELSSEEIVNIWKAMFKKALKMTGVRDVTLKIQTPPIPDVVAVTDLETKTIYANDDFKLLKHDFWSYYDLFSGQLNFENYILRIILHELGHISISVSDIYRIMRLAKEEGWSVIYLDEKLAEEYAQRLMSDLNFYAMWLSHVAKTAKDKEDLKTIRERIERG